MGYLGKACLLTLVVYAAACGQSRQNENTSKLGADEQTGECQDHSDCPSGEFCNSRGECAPRDSVPPGAPCTDSMECNPEQICDPATGRCVYCTNDAHCEPPMVCLPNGSCGLGSSGCTSDADCGALVCNVATSTCVECVDNADCPTGQQCRNNVCFVGGSDPIPCTTHDDCTSYGMLCDGGECAPCSASLPCPTGFACESEQCVPETGEGEPCATQADCNAAGLVCTGGTCERCTSDAECGLGKECTSAGLCAPEGGSGSGSGTEGSPCIVRDDCGGLACIFGVCSPCLGDFTCFDIVDILTGEEYLCQPDGTCQQAECYSAEDCPAGEGCFAGQCGPCVDASECRAGESCDTSSGTCVPECTSNTECTEGVCRTDGTCGPCTSSLDCAFGESCDAGVCVEPPEGTKVFGEACSSAETCADGLFCLGEEGSSVCTTFCIGSGVGGDVSTGDVNATECPSGWACTNFESGTLDGISACQPASQLPAEAEGQPYNLGAGAECPDGTGCQTTICYNSTPRTCSEDCIANEDCAAGDVCWSATDELGNYLDAQLCFASEPSLGQPGDSCEDGSDCDEGVCRGTCGDGSWCNSTDDCGLFDFCSGTCLAHCRSNADCSGDTVCSMWPLDLFSPAAWLSVCTERSWTGTVPEGGACSSSSECEGEMCVGGVCTTLCATTADCATSGGGDVCTLVSFVNGSGSPVYAHGLCL